MLAPRTMSLTPELVALCRRDVPDPGTVGGRVPLTDADFGSLADRVERACKSGPLWVFAYGSLIWKPVFETVDRRRATAAGWHRSFCLEISNWRGSPSLPGLMMALDRGGRCDGVACLLPEKGRREHVDQLLRREMSDQEDIGAVRWIKVRMEGETVPALTFWAGPTGPDVKRKLPLERVAWVLARACGHIGSGAEYLYQTVAHLEALGISDRNLWRLQALVADEIRSIHCAGSAA